MLRRPTEFGGIDLLDGEGKVRGHVRKFPWYSTNAGKWEARTFLRDRVDVTLHTSRKGAIASVELNHAE